MLVTPKTLLLKVIITKLNHKISKLQKVGFKIKKNDIWGPQFDTHDFENNEGPLNF